MPSYQSTSKLDEPNLNPWIFFPSHAFLGINSYLASGSLQWSWKSGSPTSQMTESWAKSSILCIIWKRLPLSDTEQCHEDCKHKALMGSKHLFLFFHPVHLIYFKLYFSFYTHLFVNIFEYPPACYYIHFY